MPHETDRLLLSPSSDAAVCNVTGRYYAFNNAGVEGPSMFKRGSAYYLTMGNGCCACLGGSNVVVRERGASTSNWLPLPAVVIFDARVPGILV